MSVVTYENVRSLIVGLNNPTQRNVRDVKWLTSAKIIGVAKNARGSVEVFLRGSALHPVSSSVANALDFRTVHSDSRDSFDANRVLLPPLGLFDQVAALICAELIREGADEALADAFAKVEPIVELAIRRAEISNATLIGLAGELLLLEAMCRRGNASQLGSVIASWDGWRRSARDFVIGSTGVEVKTTTGLVSSHQVSGVHQVEASGPYGVEGRGEDRLLLVSIGLQVAEAGSGSFSIPSRVRRIVEMCLDHGFSATEVDKFLARVSEYGADDGVSYLHGRDSDDARWCTLFSIGFVRAYRMGEPEVLVLNSSDLVEYVHVDSRSISFTIDLPVAVGYDNPVAGLNRVADLILSSDGPRC